MARRIGSVTTVADGNRTGVQKGSAEWRGGDRDVPAGLDCGRKRMNPELAVRASADLRRAARLLHHY